jgi:RES domain-containing protein
MSFVRASSRTSFRNAAFSAWSCSTDPDTAVDDAAGTSFFTQLYNVVGFTPSLGPKRLHAENFDSSGNRSAITARTACSRISFVNDTFGIIESFQRLDANQVTLHPPPQQLRSWQSIRGVDYDGTVYRNVDGNYVDGAWEVNPYGTASNHRYTGPGQTGVYAATDEATVAAELANYKMFDLKLQRETLIKDVRLTNLLDLTDAGVRKRLGVSLADITGDGYDVTQSIGVWAQARGFNGIIAPSARQNGGVNIVAFNGF